ncbi:MAG: AAA family ATPase [Bacteroidia bacterium]
MQTLQLKIRMRNIRAISDAEIKLDGITVIAGENGCGKSTISKLFYTLIKTIVEYDEIVDIKLNNRLNLVFRDIRNISRDIFYLIEREEEQKQLRNYIQKISFEKITSNDNPNHLLLLIDYLIKITDKIDTSNTNHKSEIILNRINHVLNNLVVDDETPSIIKKNDDLKKKPINELFQKLKQSVEKLIEEAYKQKEERPLNILKNNVDRYFYDTSIELKNYDIYESDVPLIDRENRRILNLNSIKHVFYIDTPMIFGLDLDFLEERPHWADLNTKLTQDKHSIKRKKDGIDKILEDDILSGDILVEKDFFDNRILYKRKDKKVFELLECATGLKSFAILRLLYKNNYLNNHSLIIIDEPEAHLHPQWVVEYARMVVLLNKHLKVKFLIASHHPDMISAIKYISEKEGNSKNLRYYLAEKSKENEYLYKYIDLNTNIEKIFESFNVALERIDLYGKTE